MNRMRFVPLALFSVFLFFPATIHAEEINAGFVQGLWFSEEPFFAGETVRMYVAIQNNSEGDLIANVEFTDNDEVIDTMRVNVLEDRVIDAWVDWTPDFGEHTIEASLTDIFLDGIEVDFDNATVTYPLASVVRKIDRDTDNDGIGNEEDEDDDNDGISDEDELKNGTDPLVFNEPEPEEKDENESKEDDQEEKGEGTDEETAERNDAKEDTNENNISPSSNQGLETFFDDGVSKNVLRSIANLSNKTKDTIDTHRTNRAEKKREEKELRESELAELSRQLAENPDQATSTDDTSSLGDITRSQSELEGKNDGPGFIVRTFDALYTFILWILSGFFAYPGLVQFVLLVLILVLLYKTAKRLASRPQD